MGPCMLHNPSYDFNDELIPLGATVWVRLAEKWLAHARADEPRTMKRHRTFFAQSYAEARAQVPRRGRRPPGWTSVAHAHPLLGRDGETLAMDVARDRRRRRRARC